MYICDRNV